MLQSGLDLTEPLNESLIEYNLVNFKAASLKENWFRGDKIIQDIRDARVFSSPFRLKAVQVKGRKPYDGFF